MHCHDRRTSLAKRLHLVQMEWNRVYVDHYLLLRMWILTSDRKMLRFVIQHGGHCRMFHRLLLVSQDLRWFDMNLCADWMPLLCSDLSCQFCNDLRRHSYQRPKYLLVILHRNISDSFHPGKSTMPVLMMPDRPLLWDSGTACWIGLRLREGAWVIVQLSQQAIMPRIKIACQKDTEASLPRQDPWPD